MQSRATTVKDYLAELPADRRKLVDALRKAINAGLGRGTREGMQYGMIGWYVPHSRFPAGYHCNPEQPLPFAGLASQKNNVAVYLFCTYTMPGHAERFAKEWKATGKKLDMGKSCVRIKQLEQTPLEVITAAIQRVPLDAFLEQYVRVTGHGADGVVRKKASKAKHASRRKKPAAKKATTT